MMPTKGKKKGEFKPKNPYTGYRIALWGKKFREILDRGEYDYDESAGAFIPINGSNEAPDETSTNTDTSTAQHVSSIVNVAENYDKAPSLRKLNILMSHL